MKHFKVGEIIQYREDIYLIRAPPESDWQGVYYVLFNNNGRRLGSGGLTERGMQAFVSSEVGKRLTSQDLNRFPKDSDLVKMTATLTPAQQEISPHSFPPSSPIATPEFPNAVSY